MALEEDALDGERLFVDNWERRTHVRTAATPEEDPVITITTRVIPPLHLPGGRLTDRRQPSAAVRRAWAAVALSAIAVCGALLGAGSLAGAGQATDPPAAVVPPAAAPSVHVVQPGDTLWSVARGLQPQGDVRPLVSRLRAASGGGPLVPGQRLRLDA